jgi:methionyl-tRNA synthetase
MKKKILITSALPYANGPLHFGHIAGAYLPGDCYARFQRLSGNDVLYVCGSDEYGVAITLTAEVAGRTPQEHVDIYHNVIKDFFGKLHLSFDNYSRTTRQEHIPLVQRFFLDLYENGYIEERVTDQLYSEEDDRFLADRYVVGECPKCGYAKARGDECQKCGASYDAIDIINPCSKLTGSSLSSRATKHWFLLLDKFQDELSAWIEQKEWKPNVVNFAKHYIDELHARAITRDSNWGVPVPLEGAEGKVIYVWFDAPIGYISSSMEWAQKKGEPDLWKDYWCDPDTKMVNFIGKDNIPFHAVIFPMMTMCQNQPYKVVDELPANEFYNLEGRQFSKSDGWYIDLDSFFENYTSDQIRYSIAANAPETSDSEFTWKDFQMRCNSELLGKYGNLVNRVLVFAKKQCEGVIPGQGELQAVDKEFLSEMRRIFAEGIQSFESFKVRKASQLMMELAQAGNVYFDHKQPWKDAKNEETRPIMETTIWCCLECLKYLSLLSYPIIPDTANKLWSLLSFSKNIEKECLKDIPEIAVGGMLPKPFILFQRVEDEQIQIEIEKLAR